MEPRLRSGQTAPDGAGPHLGEEAGCRGPAGEEARTAPEGAGPQAGEEAGCRGPAGEEAQTAPDGAGAPSRRGGGVQGTRRGGSTDGAGWGRAPSRRGGGVQGTRRGGGNARGEGRHERLVVQRVGRRVLPAGHTRGAPALGVRVAAADGRGPRHLPPPALARDARPVGGRRARRL